MLHPSFATAPDREPRFARTHDVVDIGHALELRRIQARFNEVPVDPYVAEGFRHKSIVRVRVSNRRIAVMEHGPLFQPKELNPVHGDIVRHYPAMDERLVAQLEPAILRFAKLAHLGYEHEILVQAQRVTASSGEDGHTGFPVVEGWHRDNTKMLGILVIDRVNVSGGVSLVARDKRGTELVLEQTLQPGELVLIDDAVLWHNATPVVSVRPDRPAHRDIVILTWPSCRAPASRQPTAAPMLH